MRNRLPIILAVIILVVAIFAIGSAGAADKKVNVNVSGAPLNLVVPVGDAALADVTLDGTDQNATGVLGVVRVVDPRGTGQGWYVTLVSTNFEEVLDPSKTIPSGAGGFQVTAANVSNISGNGGVTGNAGNLAPAALTVMDSPSPNGRGINEANPDLDLQVPAETYIGTYAATVTETLISY